MQAGQKLTKSLVNTLSDYFKGVEVQKSHTKARRKQANDKTQYKNIFCAFDIETSRYEPLKQSFMYIWQFAFGNKNVCHYITGREWSQFVSLIEVINNSLKTNECIMCFVHNLSYEFQFLSGILHFETENVFNTDRRKVLKARYKNIEFRCSYILTNSGLGKFTEDMGVSHQKLDGTEFDYKIVRYPWTVLTDRQMEYCLNDVIGLVEALDTFFKIEDDNYYTIPLTSTGFVRRDMKKVIANGVSHRYMCNIQPDYKLFCVLKESFRGGNTHSNRWNVDSTLENVMSHDRSSSYPDVLINRQFPISKFNHCGYLTLEEVTDKLSKGYALLMRVEITGFKLKDDRWGFPYISISKCRCIEERQCVMDNGRILQTNKTFQMTITDVDLAIILNEYDIDELIFLDCWQSVYGDLPKPIKDYIISLYKKKTELKGIEEKELDYYMSKQKINACYGMMVQDPTKLLTLYEEGRIDKNGQLNEFFISNEITPEIALEKYTKKGFLAYQWGVWCTSWARFELEEALRLCDPLGCDYCDTDSVKHHTPIDFTAYNERCIANSKKNGAFAVDKFGTTHYMGVFEEEDTALKFITQGAKKYCCEFPPDKKHPKNYLKLTCAGVLKNEGARELEEAGGIEKFRNGFVFRLGGGTTSIYNDNTDLTIEVDGHKLHLSKNVYITDDFYTLGKTGEYEKLLTFCRKTIDFVINGDKITISTETVQQK